MKRLDLVDPEVLVFSQISGYRILYFFLINELYVGLKSTTSGQLIAPEPTFESLGSHLTLS